ncbi:hypothetical protein I545_3100 [Mycobacterium kansasii 662]|uniref:Uncharacterized protein n=2 Tax=Mycobacterium kansasii TaxID=1768 RepID=A0A1V3XMM3_MYCKA|nr:hypothetical protein I547_3356 [Mycobacterium kansasii 824]EUA17724.1 hypothetical protein I545_3100 [Mycobacterium kansasii 662]OOK79217.1 hypothetical protein BZL30_2845 [Mycobacterium kansasii]OOK80358.1 hypothetical protein BZL29_2784 [Mycobacterium kansasii]
MPDILFPSHFTHFVAIGRSRTCGDWPNPPLLYAGWYCAKASERRRAASYK